MKKDLLLFFTLALFGLSPARADDPRASAIAPFVDADVIALGRLDLVKVDIDKLAQRLVTDQEQAGEITQMLAPWVEALRKAGAREIYLLVALPDVLNPVHSPPPVIVPLAEGADAKAIGALLCGGGNVNGPIHFPTCATIHNAVFAGNNEALERVRQMQPVARPEIASAWTTLGDTGAELLLIPSPDTRRVVEEMLPNLPRELGGGPITSVSRGLSWMAIGLNQDPGPQLKVIVQGKDQAATSALKELGKTVLQYIGKLPPITPGGPDFARLADDLKAEVTEDRISVTMDAQKASKWATALTAPIRGTAARRQCVNNLKQIALAMHNYHSVHHSFPPAYTVDKAGKPLLSWRVLILPYLEQNALYKEFHLDEPWDSPHNKPLIERMPVTYRCPVMSSKRADAGKTTYLTPRGKSTIFPGPEGVKLQKITDGTSNTIFVVDASNERAVVWTKPDDWDVEPTFDMKVLFGHHPGGTNFAFADGSVRFIKDKVDPKVMQMLITKDGGEVIDQSQF
jgi:prepilin-type processing-associated H-X9-DG protein